MTVHEFAHSYFNALIDKHYSEVAKAGDELYSQTASAMRRQAYGDGSLFWKSPWFGRLPFVTSSTIKILKPRAGPSSLNGTTPSSGLPI